MIGPSTKKAFSRYSLPGGALLLVLIAIVSHWIWRVEELTATGLLAAMSKSLLVLGACALGLFLLVRLVRRLGPAYGLHLGRWGSDAALQAFIDAKRRRLSRLRGGGRPLARARTQTSLGRALGELAARDSDNDALGQAAEAFRQALPALRAAGRDAKWARTQTELAATLLQLSRSEIGRASLEEAETVLRATGDAGVANAPERRDAQTLLCAVLTRLGRLQAGPAALAEAVAVGEAVLAAEAESDPSAAGIRLRIDLSQALAFLGAREIGSARLEDAAKLAREGLRILAEAQDHGLDRQVSIEFRLQLHGSLGRALRCLGERSGGPETLREAVASLRAAVPLRTSRNAYDWAVVQDELSRALLALCVCTKKPELLTEAYSASDSALSILTRESHPFDWAVALSTRAMSLGALVESESTLRRAGEDLRAALEVFDRIDAPLQGRQCRRDLDRIMAVLARNLPHEAEDARQARPRQAVG
ncbi:MAG: hypothetical protein QNJ30_08490 [Kiloniellales bacterium]|nr:hypothetical protein [Kiloniellales bacterium]